jgi:hypothetical protein
MAPQKSFLEFCVNSLILCAELNSYLLFYFRNPERNHRNRNGDQHSGLEVSSLYVNNLHQSSQPADDDPIILVSDAFKSVLKVSSTSSNTSIAYRVLQQYYKNRPKAAGKQKNLYLSVY